MSAHAQPFVQPGANLDKQSRNETTEPCPSSAHRVDSVCVLGGFLDGLSLDLSGGLNCIIGARGTGKTTLLELVRFALNALPDPQNDPSARRRIESLVEQNLDGGRVELTIETKDGLRYVITRAAGDAPIVLNADGAPTDIRLGSGGLFRADIYSQNEVETIADRPSSQLALIDNFERDRLQQVATEIAQVEQALATNAGHLLPLGKQIAALSEAIAALPEIEEKLKGYAETAGSPDEPVNRAHAMKSLRDREARALAGTRDALTEGRRRLEEVVGWLDSRVAPLFPEDVLDGPNGPIMNDIASHVRQTALEVDEAIQQVARKIDQAAARVDSFGDDLAAAHQRQEMEFRSIVEAHQAAQSSAAERTKLERARNDLLAKQQRRDEIKERRKQLFREREKLAHRLSELRDQRFAIRQTVVSEINEALSPSIRVTLMQSGDPSPYRDKVAEALRSARVRHNMVAQKLTNAFWPADLVSIVQKRERDRLIDEAELSAEQADRVLAALCDSPVLLELESVELLDLPRIELRDGEEYKDSTMLSTGQKCTAILPILLLDSDHPLLVDQPEDNLDNRFIFECVVDSIRKIKRLRQLIFVTHNPNIPVLGDAERVFVLESNGSSARLAAEGDVDACKDEIVTLLEGGEDAFKERRRRYAY